MIMNQGNLEKIHQKVIELRSKNARHDIVQLSRDFRKKGVWDPVLVQAELVGLLELGKFQRAKNVYHRCKGRCNLPQPFLIAFQRYSQYQILAPKAKDIAISTVDNIKNFILENQSFSAYLQQLRSCSDFIILSNSSSLSFSEGEKKMLRSMSCPLFIYLNIGNPLLIRKRYEFYGPSFKELVVGGFQHVFDADGRMIFKPMDQSSFLGCLLRVNQRFRSRWLTEFDPLIRKQNNGLDFDLIACQDQILDLYTMPLPSFSRELIPTIGWISLAMFEAFSAILPDSPRLWVGGFDLSPSYIFEACNLNWRHDFALEKAALDFRIGSGLVHSIGSIESREVKAPLHLSLAGMSSSKLSDRINDIL